MKLMMTCKEAAALLVAQEDRALGLGDKFGVRLHLLICKACPRFEKQLTIMRYGMQQWRNYSDDSGGELEK